MSYHRANLVACQQAGPSGTPDAASLALLQQEAAREVDVTVPVTSEGEYALALQSAAQRMLRMLGTNLANTVCAPILSKPDFESLLHR